MKRKSIATCFVVISAFVMSLFLIPKIVSPDPILMSYWLKLFAWAVLIAFIAACIDFNPEHKGGKQ